MDEDADDTFVVVESTGRTSEHRVSDPPDLGAGEPHPVLQKLRTCLPCIEVCLKHVRRYTRVHDPHVH